MSKGKIIFYDDDPVFTSQFQTLMEDSGFEIVLYNDLATLRKDLYNRELMLDVKSLVFDLAKDKEEARTTREFDIIKDIEQVFHELRIPIFIHSTWASEIEHFNNCGTVWKIVKGGESVEKVVNIISTLDGAGFIEVFTPGGILEQNLHKDLHRSFTEQFREDEIEKIINSINPKDEDSKQRTIDIFKRIAVRSLLSDVISPSVTDHKGVNPIEHYYRRISKVDLWTGDIFQSEQQAVLILTPRCNIMTDESILVCPLIIGEFPSKEAKVKEALNNKPEYSGYNRHLPPSPVFDGGKVLLSKYFMISREDLNKTFKRIITLSDELTNEILGKFGAYFFRTGITPFNPDETIEYIKGQQG